MYYELLPRHLCLLLDPFVIQTSKSWEFFDLVNINLVLGRKVWEFKTIGPVALMQIEKHLLFEFVLSVVYSNTVVVPVQAVCLGHSTRFLKMSNMRSRLSGFSLSHHSLLIDRPKGVNDNSALDWLYGVNDDCHCSRVEHLLWLLSLDIGAREPGAKTWMRVVPPNTTLIATYLLHHVHELLLVDGIDRLNRDCGAHLRHWEDIDDAYCVVIVDLTNHQTHNFKGHTSCTMLHHF